MSVDWRREIDNPGPGTSRRPEDILQSADMRSVESSAANRAVSDLPVVYHRQSMTLFTRRKGMSRSQEMEHRRSMLLEGL